MGKPNPGTREAQDKGCTCPVLDNNNGQGVPDGKGGFNFWTNGNCPLHGTPQPKESDKVKEK